MSSSCCSSSTSATSMPVSPTPPSPFRKAPAAWLLDPPDQLATPIAREGERLPVHIEDTETNFSVAWTGTYESKALFVYREKDSGNIRSIFGNPARRLTQQISKMLGGP